ncbi:MAG: ATP-binding protein [Cyanothece sp. SIO2G6]|nr:ATP-binding protein [Cyanothece sp. SIO2G6]
MCSALEWLKRACIQVPTDLNALEDVLAWFDELEAPIPKMTWFQCQLALVEGFTNAVRHAHQGKPSDTPIDIEARLTEASIEFRIWDEGPGFAFEEYVQRSSNLADNDSEGGRGLGLINRIADDLEYAQEPGQRNCLRIVKQYSADADEMGNSS